MQNAGAPASAVRPVVFTTDGLPHRQRLEAWNAIFETVNSVVVPDPSACSLSVLNENWVLGPMLLSRSRSPRSMFERSRRHVRLDGLDHWVVRVLREGHNRVQLGNAVHDVEPGQLLLFSLDRTTARSGAAANGSRSACRATPSPRSRPASPRSVRGR